MAGTNRNISVRAVGDFSNLSQGIRTAQNEITSFADRVKSKFAEIGEIGRGIKDVFEVFKQVGESVGELANRAAELDGGMSSLNRTLGASAVGYMQWANSTAKSFGISQMSAVEYGKSIAMLLGDVYKNQGQLAAATEQLMQGGAVIAAKTGKSQQEVYEELNSALMGHAAAVKSLDINVMENALVHSQAYKQIANNTPWAQLTAEQQQYIRVTELNRQIQEKFGDTIGNGMDAKLMLFKASIDNIQTSLAQAFAPILYRVLPILTTFMNAIGTAINYVAAFFQVLFGYSGIQAGMSSGIDKHAQAVNALGDAYDNAGKKAKKANSGTTEVGGKKSGTGFTANFDQVHTIPEQSNSGAGSGGAAGVGADGGLPDMSNALGNIGDNAKGVADNLEKIREKVAGVANAVKGFFEGIGNFFKQHKVLMDVVIGGLIGLLAGLGAAFALIGFSAIATFLETIGVGFVSIIGPILLVGIALGALGALFIDLYNHNKGFRDFVTQAWTDISNFAKQVFNDMWSAVKATWDKYGADIWNGIKGVFKSIQEIIVNLWNNYFKPILMDGIKTLRDLWDQHLKGLFAQVSDFVGKLIVAALDIWNKFISPIINWLIQTLGPIFESIFSGIFTKVGQFVGVVADVASGVFKALGGIIDFITGVFTGNWSKAWQGIKDVIAGIFQGFEAIIKKPINDIIDVIDSAIGKINGLKHSIPGADQLIPDIPTITPIALANGGITNGPMMALVGDNPGGQEVVSPLDKLTGIVTNAVITAMNYNNRGSNSPIGDIVLNLEGRQVARILKPWLDLENKRVGTNVRLQSI